jgi:hypothetical protein
MHILVIFVVLMFSAALFLYALPLFLYIAPVIMLGLIISFATDASHHRSKSVGY